MHSSNNGGAAPTSNSPEQDLAPKVLSYVPPRIDRGVPRPALNYIEQQQKTKNDFHMSQVIKVQTGVEKIEAEGVATAIEEQVLEKLKETQEGAYQQAYELGLEEGRAEAFKAHDEVIQQKLTDFEALITSMVHLKTELVKNNEVHLVQLIFEFAKRLAMKEIIADNESLVHMLKEASQLVETEERLTILTSPDQLAFLEELKREGKREFEILQKAKLAASDEVSHGGCIIQTNYTEVDARTETRVEKLWEELSQNLFKVKDQVKI